MASIEDARRSLGQLFIIGFSGLELPDETAAFISQAGIGGVILFSPNYESVGQVAELINQVQESRSDLPLWVTVDHEGGRVQRFKKGFTRIPDAATLAATDSPKTVFDVSELMARELKAVGVNVNFAPVADINTNPKNPVIGARAFGSSEDRVSKLVTAFVRGHLVAGVQPCVKHFPGHGDTSTDSHFSLPKVDTPVETLRDREVRPFTRAFKSRCAMVMTAHVMVPSVDKEFPATLSKKILRDLLRKELRYTRLIISDDLEMKAITDHFGPEDAPRLAVEAGCDLLIYRSEAAARHAYDALGRALDQGKLSPDVVIEAAERINNTKKETLLPYNPITISDVAGKIGLPESLALIQKIEAEANK
jgi:beta-N-acetylhexosaminidase